MKHSCVLRNTEIQQKLSDQLVGIDNRVGGSSPVMISPADVS